jgi:hypothetical protein
MSNRVLLAQALASGIIAAAATVGAARPQQQAVEALGLGVIAQITAAVTDESKLDPAYQQYQPWLPQAQAFPALQPQILQATQAFGQAITLAVDRDRQACRQHDLNQIARLAGLRRWVSAHPLVLVMPGVDVAPLQLAAQDCATFELELESAIIVPTKYGPLEVKVEGKTTLVADVPDSEVRATGGSSLDYVFQKWPQDKCKISGTGTSGTFSVQPLQFAIDSTVPFKETVAATANVTLTISQAPVEHLTAQCPDGTESADVNTWMGGWTGRRVMDALGSGGMPSQANIAALVNMATAMSALAGAGAGAAGVPPMPTMPGMPGAAPGATSGGGTTFSDLPLHGGAVIAIIKTLSGTGPAELSEDGELRVRHTPR